MKDYSPAASFTEPATSVGVRAFSKTLALTYVGLGFFAFILIVTSLYHLRQALLLRLPSVLLPCAILLTLDAGFIYVMLALHERRIWARYIAVLFWLVCLIWTGSTIVRNGSHPQPDRGPFKYSNAQQFAGARFTALVSPYLMAILELTALYCLLRKASVVNQFTRPIQTR